MNTQDDCLLTFIIPFYNCTGYLERLLQSIPVRSQFQVVAIDDRSDDPYEVESLAVLQHAYAGRVTFLTNDRASKGPGTCRNIGLDAARGRFVVFADADDFLVPGCGSILDRYLQSDADIVYFMPESRDENGIPSDRNMKSCRKIMNYLEEPDKEHLMQLKISPDNPVWSKLIRRSLLTQHQIHFEDCMHAEDCMFMAQAGMHARGIEVSRERIYCVCSRKGSVSSDTGLSSFNEEFEMYVRICRYLMDRISPDDARMLHLTGAGKMARAIRRGYGMKEYLFILKTLRTAGIPLLHLNTINPVYLLRTLRKGNLQ